MQYVDFSKLFAWISKQVNGKEVFILQRFKIYDLLQVNVDLLRVNTSSSMVTWSHCWLIFWKYKPIFPQLFTNITSVSSPPPVKSQFPLYLTTYTALHQNPLGNYSWSKFPWSQVFKHLFYLIYFRTPQQYIRYWFILATIGAVLSWQLIWWKMTISSA